MAKDGMNSYKIGEVAREAGVGVETIRFYEREGLLPEPPRRRAVHHRGYRVYGPESLHRLRFILRAKQLGFSLAEIRSLLELQSSEEVDCQIIREKAEHHLSDVEDRLKDLQRMRHALQQLIDQCDKTADLDGCPFLEYLNEWKEEK